VLLNALKDRKEANRLQMTLPTEFHFENFITVITDNNYQLLLAFKNSFIITAGTVILLIGTGSLAGYVLQRRRDRLAGFPKKIVMTGLMLPTAIIPTIWVLKGLHIYKTFPSIILLEVALNISFTIMLYQGFMDTVPVELEEAAYIDGAGYGATMVRIIFPMAQPSIITIILFNFLSFWNEYIISMTLMSSATGQKTLPVGLLNLMQAQQSAAQFGVLYAGLVLVMLPTLILYICVQKKLTQGMTVGGLKG